MAREISNSEDFMDSRDIIERIEELEAERAALTDEIDEIAERDGDEGRALDEAKSALGTWDAGDEAAKLKILLALQNEAQGYAPDWRHGATLIRDTYFTEYAKELAHDTCEMGKASDWPFRHIDWEAAAEEMKQDYTSVSFDGVDYWIR